MTTAQLADAMATADVLVPTITDHIDAGLIGSQVELVRQAFHESFAAAFTGTLRLNLIWPIAIAILVAIALRSKEAKTGHI